MSPCLLVRAGRQRLLLPSGRVGRIGAALPAGARCRVLDARRLDPEARERGGDAAVALEWRRPALLVLVDAVEDLVDPDPRDIARLPRAVADLGMLFDAAWYDRRHGRFALRVRADAAGSGPRRRLAELVRTLRSDGTLAP